MSSETKTLGPCTECGTPRGACTAPDYCCVECLHFPPDWEGYAPTQAAEPTGDVREALMKWLSAKVGGMCFEEAPWQEWGDEADELLTLPAVRDALAAQEAVKRVEYEAGAFVREMAERRHAARGSYDDGLKAGLSYAHARINAALDPS